VQQHSSSETESLSYEAIPYIMVLLHVSRLMPFYLPYPWKTKNQILNYFILTWPQKKLFWLKADGQTVLCCSRCQTNSKWKKSNKRKRSKPCSLGSKGHQLTQMNPVLKSYQVC